jgi:adenosylcobinamide-phosphate synthase
MLELAVLAERMLPATAALVLAAIAGWAVQPAVVNANPLFWQGLGWFYAPLVRKLYRLRRSRSALRWRGAIVTLAVLAIAVVLAVAARVLHNQFSLGGMTQIVLVALCLSAGQAWSLLLRLYKALKQDIAHKQAFYGLALSMRSDLTTTDAYGCVRLGIGYAVRIFDKGCVAPLFWFIVAGLPGLFVYTALISLVWHVGKDGQSKGFGDVPVFLEHIAGIVPGIISGVVLVIATLATPGAAFSRGIQSVFAKRGRTAYSEGGWPLMVAAWALKVTLGGPVRDLSGTTIPRGWVGPKSAGARVTVDYIKRGLYLSVLAHIITAFALLLLLIYL